MKMTIQPCRHLAEKRQNPLKKISSAKKGFTLAEVIVVLLISTILVGISGSFLITSTNLLGHVENSAAQKEIADMTADFVKDRLLYAQNVSIVEAETPPALPAGSEVLFVGNEDGTAIENQGYLFAQRGDEAQPVNVFGSALYQRFQISLDFSATVAAAQGQPKTFGVSIYACANGQRGYSDKKTFRLVNSHDGNEPLASRAISGADKKYYLLFNLPQAAPAASQAGVELDGDVQNEMTWTVPQTGTYEIQVWGADGGQLAVPTINALSQNGFGGYASGTITLQKDTVLYLKAGGAGSAVYNDRHINVGGFNGGGDGIDNNSTDKTQTGTGGGGASDVRVLADDLYHRIIVAGGGGGITAWNKGNEGGNGGGEQGLDAKNASSKSYIGKGGKQNGFGSNGVSVGLSTSADFGRGGGCARLTTGYASGGGGGWYGGGAGSGGGGGGSGYVLTTTSYRPSGYFTQYGAYFFSNEVKASKTDTAKFVPKPTAGNHGFVKISLVA
jgi:prepilin-type N-terminal cleavage/methylation domain-containing protein